jgi:hypothetical protein
MRLVSIKLLMEQVGFPFFNRFKLFSRIFFFSANCTLVEWSEWSECSATCELIGTQYRSRFIEGSAAVGCEYFDTIDFQTCNKTCNPEETTPKPFCDKFECVETKEHCESRTLLSYDYTFTWVDAKDDECCGSCICKYISPYF